MVDQSLGIFQQRFDELIEVIDLFELAPRVLVEFSVTGEDMEFLEQFDKLYTPQPVIKGLQIAL